MAVARNERGWVLIDALIGLVIVSIALTALAVAYRQSAVVTISSSNQARAVYVAQQAVEELKRYDGTNQAQFAGYVTALNIVKQVDGVTFTATAAEFADPEVAALAPRVRPVRFRVEWTEPGAGARFINVVSYYYFK